MARDMTVSLELSAEDRASAVLASFEGELGKLGDSTESLGGVLRRLGVNLEENVNKKLAANEKVLAAASKAYQEGRISASDYDRATLAIAKANDKLRASMSQTTDAVTRSSGIFSRLGSELRDRFVITLGDVTALLSRLASGMKATLGAATEQEDAIKRLSNALADLGPGASHVVEALSAQADALQKTTRYSDDAINAGQAFAAAFVKSEDALKGVTQSAVDLAAGLGIDLQTAFELLTKASQGNTSTLSRYGIVLDESIPKAEKLAAVQQLIADRFGGRAVADAKTYSGALAQLGNAWGEVLEAIGNAVIKNDGIIASMKGLTASLLGAVPRVAEFAKTIVDLGVSAAPVATKSLQLLGAFLTTFALTASLAAEGVIKLGRGLVYLASLIPGVGSAMSGVADTLRDMDDAIDPFQRKAAKLAGDLGKATFGIKDFGAAGSAAAPEVAALAHGVGTLADEATRAGPAFTTYRTAAQLAAEATRTAASAATDGGEGFATLAESIEREAIPALRRVRQEATDTAASLQAVYDRSGNLLTNVASLSLGGTRANLVGGGSRLVGTGGTYGSQRRVSYATSKTYIYNPQSGRIEQLG